MVYISKMVPFNERFVAFGRVLSGCVHPGMKVRIQGPDYVPGAESKNDLFHKSIQRTVIMMGKSFKDVVNCPAGNIIGLVGIDHELKKTGTIATHPLAHNIKQMRFSVSPVVKYSVRPKNPSDLPKLKEGLIKLSKSDPMTLIDFNDSGELTIAGAGELHLEICFNDLAEFTRIDIIKGEPIVSYLEGIRGEMEEAKMSKSANKHNRIYMTSEMLEEKMVEEIIKGTIFSNEVKVRSQLFRDIMNIKDDWVKKILFYGPEDNGPNLLVDETKGIAYLNEIKEYMREGFRDITSRGPLIGENLKGVRFNLTDLTLHADAIHRTGNQITSPVSAVCKGLVLSSDPILYEPLFHVEINVTNELAGAAVKTINKRRGIIEFYEEEGPLRTLLKGFLPVRESFGFNAALMDETKGQASCVLSFSHYAVLPGSIDDPESLMALTVADIRSKRKMGILGSPDNYFDRL